MNRPAMTSSFSMIQLIFIEMTLHEEESTLYCCAS